VAEPDLALVFTPDTWVEELHRHLADHGGARVLHLVVDPAMALHERFDVLVVSWRWPALTRGLVDDLHRLGRAVLGVADRDERGALDVLGACGVDAVVHSDAAPWEFVDALVEIERGAADGAHWRDPSDDGRGRIGDVAARRRHPWVAVCGPAGTGRTEVAIELARALGAVLLDADDVAPTVTARLGLALEPNVRSAIDAVEFGVGDVGESMQRVRGLDLGVVCGLPTAAAWSHVRASEVVRVLQALGDAAPIVIDTAAPIDRADGAVARGAIARAILAEADAVVAVGLATPIGVVRLLSWFVDAQGVRPGLPTHVVFNRSTTAPFRRAELATELLRSYAPLSLGHVPDDRRVRAAGWRGSLVARGPFTKAVAVVAARVVDVTPRAGAVAS
jgi:MinD superfamily P-loop ATPase